MAIRKGSRAVTRSIMAGSLIAMAGMSQAQEPVQLTYWNWAPHIDQIVQVWNDTHPDIQVSVSRAAGAGEIVQKFSAAYTAGDAPDLTNITYQDIPAMIVNGLVADLTDVMAPMKDSIAPVAWDLVTFGGSTYGVPQGTSPMMFFYRKDILDEMGIPAPATWEEFADAARQVRAADPDKYLVHFPSGDPGLFAALTHQAGTQWWQLDGDRWIVDINDEGAQMVAEYWQGLVADDAVSTMQTWSPEWGAAMADGTLLGFLSAVWAPPLIANLAPDTRGDWSVVPLPRWSEGVGAENAGGVMGGSATVVSAATEHPEEAREFALWINNHEDSLREYVRLMNIWPAQMDARDLPQLSTAPEFLPNSPDFYEMAADIDAATPSVSWGPNVAAIFDVYRNEMGSAVQEGAGFLDVLSSLQTEAVESLRSQGYEVIDSE